MACNNDVEEEKHETKREKVKQVGGHKVKTQCNYNRGSYILHVVKRGKLRVSGLGDIVGELKGRRLQSRHTGASLAFQAVWVERVV